MERKNRYKLCRNDLILAACLAVAAVLLSVAFFVFRGNTVGHFVRITLDGQVYGTYALDADQILDISAGDGHNVIEIRNGKVHMQQADCPDGYCISKGDIYRTGETIVCLPHRLVVEICSETAPNEEFDLISE